MAWLMLQSRLCSRLRSTLKIILQASCNALSNPSAILKKVKLMRLASGRSVVVAFLLLLQSASNFEAKLNGIALPIFLRLDDGTADAAGHF